MASSRWRHRCDLAVFVAPWRVVCRCYINKGYVILISVHRRPAHMLIKAGHARGEARERPEVPLFMAGLGLISTRSWRSVAVQLPGGSSERFRTQLLNDAQGKIGRQMEPEWAETGFEPGFKPISSRTGEHFFCRPRASRSRPAQRESLGIIGC